MNLRITLKKLANSNPLTGGLMRRRYRRKVIQACQDFGATVRFEERAVSIQKGNQVILIGHKHSIYAGTLSKSFDLYFSAVSPTPYNGVLVVDYSNPKVQTLKDGLEFEFSSWPEEVEAIDGYFRWYKPKEGETVFDLGAHCGLSAYYFSKVVGPAGKVICFEPDPGNLELLRRNIARHKLENVTVVAAAIGGTDGTVEFSAEGSLGSQMTRHLGRESVGNVITVPVLTLKTAFENFGLPSLCKIDIEGAEIEALEAASDLLPAHRINFVLDTNHIVNDELSYKRVEEIFKRAGYESETISEPFFTTYARPRA